MINHITDVHAHYDEKVFDDKRKELLNHMHESGVSFIINSGSDVASSYRALMLAKGYHFIYASVGVFPLSAYDVEDNYLEEIEKLAKMDKVVAIGEIGLDYVNGTNPDFSKQMPVFLSQLELAQKLDLPVVIHDCSADEDTLKGLDEYPVKAMIHRFFSHENYADEFLKRGVYLGIGPAITYEDGGELRRVVKKMPLSQLVLETDAPFLPTLSHKGEVADSLMIQEVCEEIARVRQDVTPQEVADIALENACRLFKTKG